MRLANVEQIPTSLEVEAFIENNPIMYDDELVKTLLQQGKVKQAWLVLLSTSVANW